MIARLEVKDAKGKKHQIDVLCTEDEDPAVLLDRVSGSLLAWTEAGTTKAVGPFEVLSSEVVDA